MSANQDLDVLRNSIYSTPDGLSARASIYQWQSPWVDWTKLAIDAFGELTPGSLVLDARCGRGHYVRRLRQAHPLGTLPRARRQHHQGQVLVRDRDPLAGGSVGAPPLTDDSVDAAFTIHTLCRGGSGSRSGGVALKLSGTLIASTNDGVLGSLQRCSLTPASTSPR